MSQDEPPSLVEALDKKALHLHKLFNRGLDLTAQLRQLVRDLRAEDAELGDMQDVLCDWHKDKQHELK